MNACLRLRAFTESEWDRLVLIVNATTTTTTTADVGVADGGGGNIVSYSLPCPLLLPRFARKLGWVVEVKGLWIGVLDLEMPSTLGVSGAHGRTALYQAHVGGLTLGHNREEGVV